MSNIDERKGLSSVLGSCTNGNGFNPFFLNDAIDLALPKDWQKVIADMSKMNDCRGGTNVLLNMGDYNDMMYLVFPNSGRADIGTLNAVAEVIGDSLEQRGYSALYLPFNIIGDQFTFPLIRLDIEGMSCQKDILTLPPLRKRVPAGCCEVSDRYHRSEAYIHVVPNLKAREGILGTFVVETASENLDTIWCQTRKMGDYGIIIR